MKIILSIGYRKFLLPASANFNSLVQTLSKAQLVDQERINGRYVYVPKPDDDSLEAKVRIEMVDDNDVQPRPKRKALPEQASPDAHNTF